jgi:hypothetical protein
MQPWLNQYREARTLANALALLDYDVRHKRVMHRLGKDDALLFRCAVRQVNEAFAAGVDFFRHPQGAMRYRLGSARLRREGWYFLPDHKPSRVSRRFCITWQRCLPSWVRYPDGCESALRS